MQNYSYTYMSVRSADDPECVVSQPIDCDGSQRTCLVGPLCVDRKAEVGSTHRLFWSDSACSEKRIQFLCAGV